MSHIAIVDDEVAILHALRRLLKAVPCAYGNQVFRSVSISSTRQRPRWIAVACALRSHSDRLPNARDGWRDTAD